MFNFRLFCWDWMYVHTCCDAPPPRRFPSLVMLVQLSPLYASCCLRTPLLAMFLSAHSLFACYHYPPPHSLPVTQPLHPFSFSTTTPLSLTCRISSVKLARTSRTIFWIRFADALIYQVSFFFVVVTRRYLSTSIHCAPSYYHVLCIHHMLTSGRSCSHSQTPHACLMGATVNLLEGVGIPSVKILCRSADDRSCSQ